MKRYFDCQCGKKHIDSMARSSSDKSHNVDRCIECYNTWHGQSVVAKAKRKAEEYAPRLVELELERHAKAEAFATEALAAARPKKKTPAIPARQRTKQEIDKINFQRELDKINEEYE